MTSVDEYLEREFSNFFLTVQPFLPMKSSVKVKKKKKREAVLGTTEEWPDSQGLVS